MKDWLFERDTKGDYVFFKAAALITFVHLPHKR